MKISSILLLLFCLVFFGYSCKNEDQLRPASGLKGLYQAKLGDQILTFENETHFNNALEEVRKLSGEQFLNWSKKLNYTPYSLKDDKDFPFPTTAKLINKDRAVRIGSEYRVFANDKVYFFSDENLLKSKSFLTLTEKDSNNKVRIVRINKRNLLSSPNARSSTLYNNIGYAQQGSHPEVIYESVDLVCNSYPSGSDYGCYQLNYETVFRSYIISTQGGFQHPFWGPCTQNISFRTSTSGTHPRAQAKCQGTNYLGYPGSMSINTTYSGPLYTQSLGTGVFWTADTFPNSQISIFLDLTSVNVSYTNSGTTTNIVVIPPNTNISSQFSI